MKDELDEISEIIDNIKPKYSDDELDDKVLEALIWGVTYEVTELIEPSLLKKKLIKGVDLYVTKCQK